MVVGKTAALFAAAGAGAIPALAYSSYLVEEPIAYPYAALCFFLIAKALRHAQPAAGSSARSSRRSFAPVVRDGARRSFPAAFVLAAVVRGLVERPARAWRAGWSTGDWVGMRRPVLGAIFALTADRQPSLRRDLSCHARVQAPARSSRATGPRRRSRSAWACSRSSAGLAALFRARGEPREPRGAPVPLGRARRDRRLRSVHRHQGGLSVHRVRDARRGAEPHLHRAAPLHRHGARLLDGAA